MNNEKINTLRPLQGAGRKLFVETYGCQMNVGDTEIVVAIMQQEGYVYTDKIEEADVVLINTCSIRDNAEQRIWGRLREMAHLRRRRPGLLVGIIGCMAERLRNGCSKGRTPWISSPVRMRTATCPAWCAKRAKAAGASMSCFPARKPTPKSLPCGSIATA